MYTRIARIAASGLLGIYLTLQPGTHRALSQPSAHGAQAGGLPQANAAAAPPTFYKDVLPIFKRSCLACHRKDGIAPMPLENYARARPLAAVIAEAVSSRHMPPWLADPRFGKFANDPSLTPEEIATIVAWAEARAPAGNPKDAPPLPPLSSAWSIGSPDRVLRMPVPVKIPARGDVEYTYEIVPGGFTEDSWVESVELQPTGRAYVHHAVVYIRPPDSKWLKSAPRGVPFTASTLADPEDQKDARMTDSDMLLVYTPGSAPLRLPDGVAKFVPAGSDLVFQMHYTPNGRAGRDQSRLGVVFAKQPPAQRVLTLQLTNRSFVIPPGVDDFRVEVRGTLPNDATLLSLHPHMHLRGKRFEYNILHPGGRVETLLSAKWHFHWQLSYALAEPRLLKAGTMLQAVAWFDNSSKNPRNPDPTDAVHWGDQIYDEMVVGFFDVAVPAGVDKWKFFIRPPAPAK